LEELPIHLQRWVRDFTKDSKQHALAAMRLFEQRTGIDSLKFLDYAESHKPIETLDLIRKASDGLEGSVPYKLQNQMRSFLKHNTGLTLPTTKNSYTPENWHRAYTQEEARRILGNLKERHHRLYTLIAVESGLRAQNILDITYGYIREDFEKDMDPVAIRFPPKFYNRSKSAGFTFLGTQAIRQVRDMVDSGLIETKADARLVGVTYPSIEHALLLARRKTGIDPTTQTNHGFRKYFENALDKAGLDANVKAVIEGHFGGTRSKHYSSREWDDLRPSYVKAYPFISLESHSPELDAKEKSMQKQMDDFKAQMTAEIAAWQLKFVDAMGELRKAQEQAKKKSFPTVQPKD
jgi:hypothetical protein